MALRSVQVTMASSLLAGEEWVISYQETPPGGPNGGVVGIGGTTTSNPFTTPVVFDDTKCYTITVKRRCQTTPTILEGSAKTIQIGYCEAPCVTPAITSANF